MNLKKNYGYTRVMWDGWKKGKKTFSSKISLMTDKLSAFRLLFILFPAAETRNKRFLIRTCFLVPNIFCFQLVLYIIDEHENLSLFIQCCLFPHVRVALTWDFCFHHNKKDTNPEWNNLYHVLKHGDTILSGRNYVHTWRHDEFI